MDSTRTARVTIVAGAGELLDITAVYNPTTDRVNIFYKVEGGVDCLASSPTNDGSSADPVRAIPSEPTPDMVFCDGRLVVHRAPVGFTLVLPASDSAPPAPCVGAIDVGAGAFDCSVGEDRWRVDIPEDRQFTPKADEKESAPDSAQPFTWDSKDA